VSTFFPQVLGFNPAIAAARLQALKSIGFIRMVIVSIPMPEMYTLYFDSSTCVAYSWLVYGLVNAFNWLKRQLAKPRS
jgi:hypothetical protein